MLAASDIAILERTFLFRGLTPDVISGLTGVAKADRQDFARGEVIFSPDKFRKELGIILSGRVLVEKGTLMVSELVAGDLFGAAALFNDAERYVSTLTARSPASVLFLSQESITRIIDSSPAVRYNYLRYLSERIRFLSSKVDYLSSGSGERKLSVFLAGLADRDGQVRVRSMSELASRLGMGRASLYRELAKLEERGAISRDGKVIKILDIELLKQPEKERKSL